MKRDVELVMTVLLLVGAINWLFTGIRSLMGGSQTDDVPDLLNLLKLPQEVSNIIYILIGLVGLYVSYSMATNSI